MIPGSVGAREGGAAKIRKIHGRRCITPSAGLGQTPDGARRVRHMEKAGEIENPEVIGQRRGRGGWGRASARDTRGVPAHLFFFSSRFSSSVAAPRIMTELFVMSSSIRAPRPRRPAGV